MSKFSPIQYNREPILPTSVEQKGRKVHSFSKFPATDHVSPKGELANVNEISEVYTTEDEGLRFSRFEPWHLP